MSSNISEKIKNYLSQNPTSKIIEGELIYSIKDEQIHIESRENNTWEYVESIKNIIKENKYPTYINLEQEWNVLDTYNEKLFNRNDKNSETPLGSFLYTSELGFYPTPEILMFLAGCFERYFNMKGEDSLEDIFFGKKNNKPGVGNHSAQKSRREAVEHLHMTIQIHKLKLSEYDRNKSELDLAEEVIERMNLKIDPESLLRKYRRYIKGK